MESICDIRAENVRFFLCEQTVKGSKQDNRDNPGKDQRVLKLVVSYG